MMLTSYFRKAAYCIVLAGFCSVQAGSFEDFFVAIRNDNAGTLNDLLKRGFDPNTRDEKGQPGLTIAVQERSPKVARALLGHPAIDVNALNQTGETALMIAALKGNLDGMQMLLDRGAKVNQPGWSPLHYAATGPEPRAVQWLLDRGADIDAPSPNGTTPLMMAAQYGSEDSVTLLLGRGADAKRLNQRDMGAADFAQLSGRQQLVDRLRKLQR